MITKLLRLLAALVDAVGRHLKRKEQREAQHDREEIEADSAQYSADKFGDGRLHDLEKWRSDADKAKRSDSDSR